MISFFYRGLEYFVVITLALIYFRFGPGGTETLAWMNDLATAIASYNYSELANNIISIFR